ncbi:MAG: thioredoxin family protein [Lysobacterales bacterium]
MNITKPLTYASLALLLSTGLSATGVHASDVTTADKAVIQAKASGELYLPSEDSMADLNAGFDAARESNKLALVVMGANWCHDSRALAARIYEEPLSTTIDEQYEIIFIDVGYLEKGKDVITRLGIAAYYATPTVLIVEPASGQVVNAGNRHQWANAASISMQESVAYFGQFTNTDLATLQGDEVIDEDLQHLLMGIDAFEQIQAERLYQAYAVLAPMLKAYKEGDKNAFSDATWNEVRDYRYKIPIDIEALRAEARTRVAAGETDIKLAYPVYRSFSWD